MSSTSLRDMVRSMDSGAGTRPMEDGVVTDLSGSMSYAEYLALGSSDGSVGQLRPGRATVRPPRVSMPIAINASGVRYP